MHQKLWSNLIATVLLLLLPGCFEEKPCEMYDSVQEDHFEPAVVKLSFQLKKCNGEPIPNRQISDFVLSEDGTLIDDFESKPELLNKKRSYEMATVLLLDMSGSIVESGSVDNLQSAAKSFAHTLVSEREVAVYAFDGQRELHILVDFTSDNDAISKAIDGLSSFVSEDNSTNLNGAVIQGLTLLEEKKKQTTDKIFAGSLAIFTDGTDKANHYTDQDAQMAVAKANTVSVFTIGLGTTVDEAHLKALGKDGYRWAENSSELELAFGDIAQSIQDEANSFYSIAYCTPSRNGNHLFEVSLRGTVDSLTYQFTADGFSGGCKPEDFL